MDTLNGLPAHILLVHAVVVLLPLAAFLLVLTAVWPAARRHLALANAVLSVVVVALVPLTTSAGEWLEQHVDESDLVDQHVELGDTAIFVALPIAILAVLIWWRGREIAAVAADRAKAVRIAPTTLVPTPVDDPIGSPLGVATVAPPAVVPATVALPVTHRRLLLAPESAVVSVVLAVLSVVAAGATVYDTYRIGDSGAQATWQGKISTSPTGDIPAGDSN